MADPGFSVGGGGDVDSRGGYFSRILYVKTKESGPLGGGGGGVRRASSNVDPPMQWKHLNLIKKHSHFIEKYIEIKWHICDDLIELMIYPWWSRF